MIGYSANVMLIPTHVLKHGHSAEQVFLYVTIIKGSETLGRLFFGSLADLFRVSLAFVGRMVNRRDTHMYRLHDS